MELFNAPTSLPRHELLLLTGIVDESYDLASVGELAAGYNAVQAGLRRAMIFDAAPLSPAWTPELVTRWRIAMESYCAIYGVEFV